LLAVFALVLLIGATIVVKVPRKIAEQKLIDIKAKAETFAAPPVHPSAGRR